MWRASDQLQVALEWLAMGYTPIPTRYRSRVPQVPSWRQYFDQPATEEEVREWYRTGGLRNMQVILSHHLNAIDFDKPGAYEAWKGDHPTFRSRTVKTARGYHVHIRLEEPTGHNAMPFDGGEVLGYQHACTVPPSIHPSGVRYTYVDAGPVSRVESLEALDIHHLPSRPTVAQEPRDRKPLAERILIPTDRVGNLSPIEEIKSLYRPADILEMHGVSVRDGMCLCPFHEDNRPSMSVGTHRARCFVPTCVASKPMDVIDLASTFYRENDIMKIVNRLRGR